MAGTLQAQHILSRVRNILQDNTGVRWTDGEMFDYLSDAQREIANLRPDATATHANVQLATGTEQTIPTDGLRLIKVVRNMSRYWISYYGKIFGYEHIYLFVDGIDQELPKEASKINCFKSPGPPFRRPLQRPWGLLIGPRLKEARGL